MLDPRYDYIHSCPTNLGTGMRASVHVTLPGWHKKGKNFKGFEIYVGPTIRLHSFVSHKPWYWNEGFSACYSARVAQER